MHDQQGIAFVLCRLHTHDLPGSLDAFDYENVIFILSTRNHAESYSLPGAYFLEVLSDMEQEARLRKIVGEFPAVPR